MKQCDNSMPSQGPGQFSRASTRCDARRLDPRVPQHDQRRIMPNHPEALHRSHSLLRLYRASVAAPTQQPTCQPQSAGGLRGRKCDKMVKSGATPPPRQRPCGCGSSCFASSKKPCLKCRGIVMPTHSERATYCAHSICAMITHTRCIRGLCGRRPRQIHALRCLPGSRSTPLRCLRPMTASRGVTLSPAAVRASLHHA